MALKATQFFKFDREKFVNHRRLSANRGGSAGLSNASSLGSFPGKSAASFNLYASAFSLWQGITAAGFFRPFHNCVSFGQSEPSTFPKSKHLSLDGLDVFIVIFPPAVAWN